MQTIANALLPITGSISAAQTKIASKDDKRLASAAKEFESVMLNQWLQSAETSFGAAPGGDDDDDQGGQQMKSFGVQQLAGQLTASGGIGIAKLVQDGLVKAKGAKAESAKAGEQRYE